MQSAVTRSIAASDTLEHSESVEVQCCLVISYCSLHPVHLLGGHTLAMKWPTAAGFPRLNATLSICYIQLSQTTHLGPRLNVAARNMQSALRILQEKRHTEI